MTLMLLISENEKSLIRELYKACRDKKSCLNLKYVIREQFPFIQEEYPNE